MKKNFTKLFFLLIYFLIQQSYSFAEVSEKQLIEYIAKSTHKEYKNLPVEEKQKAYASVEQSYKTKTLTNHQKLEVYSILLIDIGLDKPEAASFKAIMLYEIEKYDIQNIETPLYQQQRNILIDFINNKSEELIFDKLGIEKTPRDIELEKIGAYSKKKEVSQERRIQAINDLYQDYTLAGINLDDYKKVAKQSFE